MARCDHADLHSMPTKALLYPECCSLQELEDSLRMVKEGYYNGKQNRAKDLFELEETLAKRRQATKSRRLHMNKPRFRVKCGRAPWPVY